MNILRPATDEKKTGGRPQGVPRAGFIFHRQSRILLVTALAAIMAAEFAFLFGLHRLSGREAFWLEAAVACLVPVLVLVPAAYLIFVRMQLEITGRAQAQQELHAVNLVLDQIFQTSAGGMWVVDAEFRVTRVNRTLAGLIGTEPDQILGHKCYEVFPGPQCRTDKCPVHVIRAGGTRISAECEKEFPSGETRIFLVTGTPFLGPEGELAGIVEDFRDISDRYRTGVRLQESTERYRNLVDNAPLGIVVCNLDGAVTEVNSKIIEILGSPSVEMTKAINVLTFPPMVEAGISASFRRCLETGENMLAEHQYTSKWGRHLFMRLHLSPIFENGNIVGAQGLVEDFMDYKKAQEVLNDALIREREHRETLDAVFESAPVGLFLFDADMVITRINRAAGDIIHRPLEEILSRTAGHGLGCFNSAFLPGGCGSGPMCGACPLRGAIGFTMASGKPVVNLEAQFDLLVEGKKATPWLKINCVKVVLEGHPLVVLTLEDITYRKEAEETLSRYRLLSENARDIIFFVDQGGWIIEANSAAINSYGYAKDELLGKDIRELRAPGDRPLVSGQLGEALEKGVLFETEHLRKDGTVFPVQVSSQSTVVGGQRVVMSIVRDISERKRMEQALREERDFSTHLILNSTVPSFVLGPDRRVLIWNTACEELTGIKAHQVVGTENHWQAFYDEERPCLADLIFAGRPEDLPQYYGNTKFFVTIQHIKLIAQLH